MVIEGYLWESLTITKDQMAIGYLVAGQKVSCCCYIDNSVFSCIGMKYN